MHIIFSGCVRIWLMSKRELSDYIKEARKVGQSDKEIKKHLLEVAWEESDIDEALAADHETHSKGEEPWKIKLENLVEKARAEGKNDKEIKEELAKLAWKEGDIDEALNSAPKSLFRYQSEESKSIAEIKKDIFSWRPDKKYLISIGLVLFLIFLGAGYSFIYSNNLKIRKEVIAQSLQTLPEEERDCVLNNVDVGFLENIQDVQAFSPEYYQEQMELLGGCVLHKATPL